MLIYFKVKNFLSFKDEVVLDMRTTKRIPDNEKDGFFLDNKSTIKIANIGLIYGANASGKSNLLKAIKFLEHLMFDSFFTKQEENIIENSLIPFEFNRDEITSFEICYLINGEELVYRIEIKNKEIIKEVLNLKNRTVFKRDIKNDNVYNNVSLFSSKIAFKDKKILAIKDKLDFPFKHISFERGAVSEALILSIYTKYGEVLKDVMGLLKKFDTGIESLKIKETEGGLLDRFKVYSVHSFGEMDFDKYESTGTKALFYHILLPISLALDGGTTVFIDELDCSIHSRIIEEIVQMFINKETNPKNAQLITTLHCTEAMEVDNLSKHHIYFVNKLENNSSEIYNLANFDDTRNNVSFAKKYLSGKYSAIPLIS